MALTRLHFIVRGRVQGIGYRWFVRESAERLGLAGWVRNLDDGTVELEAEGEAETVKDFEKQLRSGHPYARVDEIEAENVKPQGGRPDFRIAA